MSVSEQHESITIHMNTCNLFQITNTLPYILFNTCILTLPLHISNIINYNYSLDNHVTDNGCCRPKHVEVSYIYKLLSLYCFAFVGKNIVNLSVLHETCIMLNTFEHV